MLFVHFLCFGPEIIFSNIIKMTEDYSDCIKKQIDSLRCGEKLRTHFLHPKLVVVREDQVTVINIETNDEDDVNDKVYEMEDLVVDTILQDQLLWIVIATGKVSVIDILEGGHMEIELLKFASYKIRELKMDRCNLYFISESEEQLAFTYSVDEIVDKISKGISEMQIPVDKARSRQITFSKRNPSAYIHGMNVYIEDGSMVTECPMTGFSEVISSPGLELQHILAWNNLLILADDCNMWMINIVNNSIVLDFKTNGVRYYPLGTCYDKFYYLFLHGDKVKIHCITKVSGQLNQAGETNGCSSSSIKKSHSQEMLKSQVRSLIESLTLSDANHEATLFQFKILFEQIEDIKFLIGVGSKLCQLSNTYKSLIYLLQTKSAGAADENLMKDVCNIIFKMDITEYINFKGITSYDTVGFFDFDFKQLCVMFLTNSDFDLASLCWLKYSELKVSVSSDEILSILNAIPNNTKIGALIIWLKNFVPSLLDENPFHIDLLVRWTTERIFMLEHSTYWPKIGLKFIEEITNVLETSIKTIAIRPISIDDLDVLKDRIIDIMELKEKYKINMLVGELGSQTQTEVALIMLRRCYTEDLKSFVQEYLPTYGTRHGFELDDVLRTYIEGEAASGGGSIDGSRLSILLNTFRMPSTKLDCLLSVLRVLDVPWDESVYDLAVTSAAMAIHDFTSSDADRKLAREIEEELNYANLKVVLKKHNYPLTHTDYLLVIHKIINAPGVDVKDLKTIMSVTTSYKNYGSFLYIDRCLRDCNTKEALEYFGGLSEKEMRLVFKSIMCKYDHMINNNVKNQVIERSYIDFIKGVQLLDENELTSIQNMYHLKNSYETKFTINDMYREDSQIQKEPTDGKNVGPSKSVARLLRTHHSQNSALLNLLQRISTNTNVRTFFETLLMSFSHLYQYTLYDKISSTLSFFMDGKDNASFLVESSQVLVQLISNCTEEYLYYLTTILSVVNAVINTGIVMRNLSTTWKFHYIYIPISSFGIEEELLKVYAELTGGINENNDQLVMLCSKNEFVPFRLLPNLMNSKDCALFQFKEKAISKLLSRISASNEVDELFITSLLLALCKDDAEDQRYWLENLLKGYNETTPISMVTYLASPVVRRIFDLAGMSPRAVSYPPQQILKSKYNMTLADIALPDITEETWDAKLVLFYVLKQLPHIELDRLHELCYTLNVSVDDGMSLQLIARLTTWDLKYSLSTDELSRKKVCVESQENVLFRECLVIWESIRNKDFIQDILNDLWKNGEVSLHGRLISVNPYFYEVYLCIYHLIFGTSTEVKSTKEYFLLNFLKDYKRKSNPQQYEFELFSVKGMFPEIGHYRLPFHLFMRDDMWLNLKSEITLETYELWLPAVALLSLDNDMQTAKDMICSNALKQTMKTRKPESFEGESKESEPWRLSTRDEPLLRAAHRCVRHIANMEWAGACLFYVLQGCGRGADQVAAAQLCYQFAKRWESVQPGNRAVKKMERLHSTLSTRHALHKIEWATDDFVQLLAEPTQLIRAMYLHPSFVEKMSRHDVNCATNEIADKNGINISSIRIQILENILEKNNDISNKKTDVGLNNKTLMTAKYILKATCPKMGAIYLSRIAFDDETDFNKDKKLRALQCLMSIVEPDTALKVTNQERDLLWNSLLEIYYAVSLEKIGMPWAVGAFMQDKNHALEQILAAIGANTDGLKLIAELAYRYGDRQIYLKLLKFLQRAGLNEEMIPLLLRILSPPDEVVRTAWHAVLLSPFQSADYPITDRQKSNCMRSINLLPLCPVVRDEDLKEIWKNCVRCKCFGIGCLVLPYMTNEARLGLGELRRIDRRNLIASLKNLHTETYLVSGAMYVIENMIPKSSYR